MAKRFERNWEVSIPCPSCKGQGIADITKGTWKCEYGDYGKCGFQ